VTKHKLDLKTAGLGEILGRRINEIQRLFHDFIGIHTLFYDADNRLLSSLENGSPYECLKGLLGELDRRRKSGDYEKIAELKLAENLVMTARTYAGGICEYEIPYLFDGVRYGYIRLLSSSSPGPEATADSADGCIKLHYIGRERVIERARRLMPILEAFLLMGARIRELEQTLQGLAALYRTGQMLTAKLDLEEVLQWILRLVAETLDVKACTIRLLNRETGRLEVRATFNLSEKYLNKGPVMAEHSGVDMAAMRGETVAIKDLTKDERVVYPREMAEEGLASLLCVGLRLREEPIGVIRAYSASPRDFSDYEVFLFEALANYAVIAIDYARRFADSLHVRQLEHEFKLAAQIQKRITPSKLPEWPGYDVAAMNIPYRQIGGDFYDVWDIPDEHLGLVIADGSGKSIPGSLLMAMTHAALRVQAMYAFRTSEIIDRTNRFICRQTEVRHFVSLFYGALNRPERVLTYTNAGHIPPVVVRKSGDIYLDTDGMVIGVEPNITYEERQMTLEPGDVLVMTTDGVTEAMSPGGELFGYERLIAVVRENQARSACEIVRSVCDACSEFTRSSAPKDDVTLCVVKIF